MEKPRNILAGEATGIKDKSILWLKASLHQILNSFPQELITQIIGRIEENRAIIIDILTKTNERNSLRIFLNKLKDSNPDNDINQFINSRLDMIIDLANKDNIREKRNENMKNRPKEQKTRNKKNRENIIGARPDTYVNEQETGLESLFLVETRKTTKYLKLENDDKYKPLIIT